MKRSCTARRNNFDELLAQGLPALNDSLKSKGQQQIAVPQPTKIGATDATHESGGVAGASDVTHGSWGRDSREHDAPVRLPHLAIADVVVGRDRWGAPFAACLPRQFS